MYNFSTRIPVRQLRTGPRARVHTAKPTRFRGVRDALRVLDCCLRLKNETVFWVIFYPFLRGHSTKHIVA